jgi:hypothetical protein
MTPFDQLGRACQPRAVTTPRTMTVSLQNWPSWAGNPVAVSNAFQGWNSLATASQ